MGIAELKSKFLPDAMNRRLFPFFVAWLVALGGGVLVFVGFELSWRALSLFGFFVAVVGVLFGFGWVLWFFYRLLIRGDWKIEHEKYLESLKPKQPWQ